MLLIVLMLSTSLAEIAFMGEKAMRNERDKQIAMNAAESALNDAEKDIEHSTAAESRSAIFSSDSAEGFSESCGRGDKNSYQGLCINHEDSKKLTWLTVDIANALTNTSASSSSVQFGHFTGQTMPTISAGTSQGPFPAQLPRYIIELMIDNAAGQSAKASYMYRITAIGFGAESATQIVLQSFYRKTES
jgi:type IV pilus assembly protein PilX